MRRVLFVFLAACATTSPPPPPPKEPPEPQKIEDLVGKPSPRFSLPSARGDGTITVPSAEVTVVTFFGSWSPGWHFSLPVLDALHEKHPKVRVVAVSMDEVNPKSIAEQFVLPIAWAGGLNTPASRAWLSGPYGGENKVFVLDRKGVIRFAHRGGKETSVLRDADGQKTVEDEIVKLLAEP